MWSRTIACCLLLTISGCAERQSGTVEIYGIRESDRALQRPLGREPFMPKRPPGNIAKPITDGVVGAGTAGSAEVSQTWGDSVRSTDDVITIAVQTAHIQKLPAIYTSLTSRSYDVILFADVQENAAAGYDAPPLTTVVYVGKDQRIPGRLNFHGNLAYGPTYYKGHPLKIKFTLLMLQERKSEQQAKFVDIAGGIVASVTPQYATAVSAAVNVIRSILRSLPDVVAFDFELTLFGDHPTGLRQPLIVVPTSGQPPVGNAPLEAGGDASWDEAMNWVKYGFYALVETQDWQGQRVPETDALMHFLGGRLSTSNPNASLLPTNYMVFSIIPGQLAEEDDTLLHASKLNESLIKTLSRSEQEIAQAVADIKTNSEKLVSEYLRIRMEREAQRLKNEQADATRRHGLLSTWVNTLIPMLPADQQTVATNVWKMVDLKYKARWNLPTDGSAGTGTAGTGPEKTVIEANAKKAIVEKFKVLWQIPDGADAVTVSYNPTLSPPKLTATVRLGKFPDGKSKADLDAELKSELQKVLAADAARVSIDATVEK